MQIIDQIVGRRFVVVDNHQGLSGAETIFEYRRRGDFIIGEYAGGLIRSGQIIGYVVAPDGLALAFQCLTVFGELRSGRSRGRVKRKADGRLQIDFDWAWLETDVLSEHSRHEEITTQG